MEKQFKRIPLNIQLMASDDNGNGEDGNQTPKTYSQEEMDKIIAERDKLKQANDNLSKENADHKRKQKERMSEEEKQLEVQKEKDKILADTQKELLGIKLSKEFTIAGFDEATCNELVESFSSQDNIEFAKTLSKKIKELVENVRKEELEKFKQNGILPPNGTKHESGVDPIVERYLKQKSTNSNDARELYLKRNNN